MSEENKAEFDKLLLHTEFRWLPLGKILCQQVQIFDSVLNLFRAKA